MILLRQTRCALSRRRHVAYFHASSAWWAARKVLQRFKLADVGEGITECEVIRWYVPRARVSGAGGSNSLLSSSDAPLLLYRSVSPQSSIGVFEPLCEVQSDKASVEITSPYDGTVKEILVQEGQVAKVGESLCIIEVDEEDSNMSDIPTSEPPHAKTNESSPPPPQEQGRDASVGVPQTPSDKHSVARRPHPLDPNAPAASESSASASRPGTSSGSAPTTNATDVLALPSVRHFARESGVDIALLAPGSGKDGRVERADVEWYLASGKSAVPGEQQPSAVSPSPPAGDDIIVELGRTRYGMWKAMEKARALTYLSALRCLIVGCGRCSYTEPGNTSFRVSEPSRPACLHR